MSTPHVVPTRHARFAQAAALAVPLLATATLGVGWFAGPAEVITGTIAATTCCGWYGFRLCRIAQRRHRSDGDGSFRSAGLFGLGLLASGVTCAAVAVLWLARIGPATASVVVAGGLGAATVMFLPALLLLPGAATGRVARLRRGLDGVSVGICLLFTAWVLTIAPNGRIVSLGFWVALLTCCTLSVAAVTTLRAGRGGPGARACSTAVALAGTGLGGLAVGLANTGARPPTTWPTVCAALIAAAPVLAFMGSRRGVTGTAEAGEAAAGPATFAGSPVLALPVAAAIAVAMVRLVTDGDFDKPSLMLGLAGISAVAVRETLAARDVSRYARHVAAREAHFRGLVAGSTDVTIVVDRDLIVRWQSPAAARQFGLSEQEVLGRTFLSLLHPDDAPLVRERFTELFAARWHRRPVAVRPMLVEARLRDGFGQWRETESTLSDQLDAPEVGAIVVHVRDVAERKELERTLPRASFVDHLTGLANRRQLLLTIVALRAAPGGRGALLQLELDGFSSVNDVRGFEIGDAVLVEVARRLRAGVDGTDLPARLGGDEFAVVTEAGPIQAYGLASRLVNLLAEPIILPGTTGPAGTTVRPGTTVHLTATVGLTDLAGGKNLDDVLRRADLARHRARQLGRGRVEWYDEAMESDLLRRMTLEQELPRVLDRGELDLVYQPVLDLAEDRPHGVEAQLRWRHPRLGTLLPADIIPVAEDVGAIDEIGAWVLNRSCQQLSRWLHEGRDLWLAVNIPAQQLAGADLVRDVTATLARCEVAPERLVVEVGENGLGSDTAAVAAQLAGLRAIGLRTALDDFGAGSGSLANLRGLPLDLIKLGKPFFGEPAARPNPAMPIIDVMVGLGRRLGFEIIAAGLECPAHLDVVRGAGCRFGQGHLFAYPQPAERIEAYLDARQSGYP